jgi:hypothetical protein
MKKPQLTIEGDFIGMGVHRPRLTMTVECGGTIHRVVVQNGTMTLKDHKDVKTLEAFTAFGAKMPPCLRLLEMWRNSPDGLLRVVGLLPPEPEGVFNFLDASTGHITEDDSRLLGMHEDDSLFIRKEFGWWVWIDVTDPESQDADLRKMEFSGAFRKLVRYAADNNCFWLNLDGDGAIILGEGLPYNPW